MQAQRALGAAARALPLHVSGGPAAWPTCSAAACGPPHAVQQGRGLAVGSAGGRNGGSARGAEPPAWLPDRLAAAVAAWRRPAKGPLAPLRPWPLGPHRVVPPGIEQPPYAGAGGARMPPISRAFEVHDEEGVERMRAAGALAARALAHAAGLAAPGVTTDAIDASTHAWIVRHGAYPSPLGYGGYPKSLCASVNECCVHGVPNTRPLQEGDILNLDVTVYKDGYHADTNATLYVGAPLPHARELVEVTREALRAAVAVCGPGVPFREIGRNIQHIADRAGMSVIHEFVGHGIGRVFHAAPPVLHHKNRRPGAMQLHQTFTIEPILALGGRATRQWRDGWTVVMADGSLSAQFEHTLLITEAGAEVLTQQPAPSLL